jgi:hypothetical protein
MCRNQACKSAVMLKQRNVIDGHDEVEKRNKPCFVRRRVLHHAQTTIARACKIVRLSKVTAGRCGELTKVRLRLRSAHFKGCPEETEKAKRHTRSLSNMLSEHASLLLLLLALLLLLLLLLLPPLA